MLHTLRRAAAINENLRTHHAPPHAATIHFINQQQNHRHREQETPDSLLQEQKRHYCRHHYHYSHHHPTAVSSARATNSTRATALADSNRYLWALTWDVTRFLLSKKLKDGTKGCPQFNNPFQNNSGICRSLRFVQQIQIVHNTVQVAETREHLICITWTWIQYKFTNMVLECSVILSHIHLSRKNPVSRWATRKSANSLNNPLLDKCILLKKV